ncbi:ubiquinol oxidase subunit II [Mangrovibacterium sp.]|uniref:ubiquinol oxidase subunit II n=1 Tax=Mangrovibacterium sp. TaxID=1961364 RepID=UPI00356731D3
MNLLDKKKGMKILKPVGLFLATIALGGCEKMVVLESKGTVGAEQAFLIKLAFVLMLIVVLPVFVMVIWFSIRYRASNTKATYKPKWTHSNAIEAVVWGVPVAIIAVLGYVTWKSTHELNPYKPLEADVEPLKIDVISTDSDWLFVYPELGVASINQFVFPVNTPLNFRLTSGSVMTSFFIPALGSQMYAMAGMQTKLHLMATEVGVFRGQNMEYSGNGYAGMHFKAISTTADGFENWMKGLKESPDSLSIDRFKMINLMINQNHPVSSFSFVEPDLFDKIMMENMHWMGSPENHRNMEEYDEPGGRMHMHGRGTMH